MKIKILAITVGVLGWVLSGAVAAASLHVGVINLEKIVQKAPQTEVVKKHLKDKFKPRETEIVKAQQALDADMNKFNRDGAVMTQKERKQLEDKINNTRRELTFKQQAFRDDFVQAQNEEMKKLLDEVGDVISQLAKAEGFDLILQEERVPYVNDKMDVTEKVIVALKKHKYVPKG